MTYKEFIDGIKQFLSFNRGMLLYFAVIGLAVAALQVTVDTEAEQGACSDFAEMMFWLALIIGLLGAFGDFILDLTRLSTQCAYEHYFYEGENKKEDDGQEELEQQTPKLRDPWSEEVNDYRTGSALITIHDRILKYPTSKQEIEDEEWLLERAGVEPDEFYGFRKSERSRVEREKEEKARAEARAAQRKKAIKDRWGVYGVLTFQFLCLNTDHLPWGIEGTCWEKIIEYAMLVYVLGTRLLSNLAIALLITIWVSYPFLNTDLSTAQCLSNNTSGTDGDVLCPEPDCFISPDQLYDFYYSSLLCVLVFILFRVCVKWEHRMEKM